MNLQPRETVILASDFEALYAWYRDALGFRVVQLFADRIHYCNLENDAGIRLGIASAEEMKVQPADRTKNTVLLQFQVDDVKSFLEHVASAGGSVTYGPSRDEQDGFWCGAFADPEGNPCWVVDANCP